MPKKFQLSVTSRLERLAEISKFVQRAAHACGLRGNACDDVQMAVDEACANVIEHAYQGKANGKIKIVCERRGNNFVVQIIDHGIPFDPKQIAKPILDAPLTERNIGGLGIFFMSKLMDQVDFDFSRGENVLTMLKKIK